MQLCLNSDSWPPSLVRIVGAVISKELTCLGIKLPGFPTVRNCESQIDYHIICVYRIEVVKRIYRYSLFDVGAVFVGSVFCRLCITVYVGVEGQLVYKII